MSTTVTNGEHWPWFEPLPTLQWRHNDIDGVSNHQPYDCLLSCLFRHRSKKTSKLCVTGLCEGNLPATGEFPAQRASNAENVSSWWRHHDHTHTPPHTHNNSNNNKNEHGEHTLYSLVSNWVSVVCWSRVTTRPLCVQYSYGVIWNAVRLDERFAVQPVYTMTVHQVGCKLPCTKWCPHHVGEMVIHSDWYISESNSRQC